MNYFIPLTIVITMVIIFQLFRARKQKQLADDEKRKAQERHKKENGNWEAVLKNDKVTKEDIRMLIPALRLSGNVLDLFDGNCKDEIMKRHFFDKDYADPYMVITLSKLQQDVYLTDRYKPVLAYSGATVFAYDAKLNGYISYDIESDVEEQTECFTWDGLFVREVLRWWEYDISEADIIYIGNFFGLKYTKEILNSILETTDGKGFLTGKELTAWENSTIEKINGLIR